MGCQSGQAGYGLIFMRRMSGDHGARLLIKRRPNDWLIISNMPWRHSAIISRSQIPAAIANNTIFANIVFRMVSDLAASTTELLLQQVSQTLLHHLLTHVSSVLSAPAYR